MSMEFGKLNFSVSFNPTSAFPLDARSYFESYAEAEKAAELAVAAGSAESVYYYGQTLVVVENDKAKFYIIQPDNTLSAVEGSSGETEVPVNSDLFEKDENGNLSLKGFDEAAIGSFFVKGEDGELEWKTPIDAYTKEETNEAIRQAVADAVHIKRKIVASTEEIEEYMATKADADQYIFMVPTGLTEDSDRYDEYMVVEIAGQKFLEKVGSWEVNLSNYVTKADLENGLSMKVDAAPGYSLISKAEKEKLAGVESGAQVNIINDVNNSHFEIDENKTLLLKDIPVSKITNLENLLNEKVDSIDGWTLLSPDDQEKLAKLVIGDEGLEISGTVNAENVQGLETWITNNAGSVIGLSPLPFTTSLANKLNGIEEGAQKNYISSVTDQFEVNINGELRLVSIASNQISDLATVLNTKADATTVSSLSSRMEMLESDVGVLANALTWKNI